MTRKLFAVFFIMVIMLVAGLPTQAASVDPSVEITGVLAGPFCNSATDGQILSQTGNTTIPASFRIEFFAPGVGQVYNVVLNFSTSGALNFTGFAVSPFALAPNTPFTIRTTTYDAPGGAGNVTFISEIVFNCTTGAVISLTNTVPDTDAAPETPAVSIPGPGVPNGFVLRMIICNTPVFDSPGGTAVGNNQITAGQTWFVNPTSANDTGGESWSEVFVGSSTNPYIPAECVNS
ncbi:MAG: hypothetical protein HY866_12530 [Chloroflexi bacterium]|nr:hypothetical protein [Chloroflexota bacterium]